MYLVNIKTTTCFKTNCEFLMRGRNCLPVVGTWGHFRFVVEWVLLIFLVFNVVILCFVFVFVLCLVCSMLPVSLDCPFLIAPWLTIFSSVYLTWRHMLYLIYVPCCPSMIISVFQYGNMNGYVSRMYIQ